MIASRTLPLVLLGLVACSRDHSQVATASAATLGSRGLGDSAVTVRRLAVDSGRFLPYAPSVDGRLMAGLDYKTGNVVVRDMGSGQLRTLTTGADWDATNVEGEAPIISPNGKLVAYGWQNGAPSFAYEVRVVGMDGTGGRVLLRPNAATREEFPLDWTPDSRSLLADLYGRDGSTQLVLTDAASGKVKVLRSFDWRGHGNAKISPNGSWIAYDFRPDERREGREIVLLRLADGRESRVTSDGVPKGFVGWSSTGDGVYYRTERGESSTIWYVPLRDGRASGQPRVVRSDVWGAQLLGVANSTLYYTVSDVRQAVYTVGVDLEAGRTTSPPATAVTGTFMRGPAAWSPDGRRIAFARITDDRRFSLVIHDVVTNEERALPLGVQYGFVSKWMPDGQSVLLIASQRNRWGTQLVDLASGQARFVSPLASSPLSGGTHADLSADARTQYETRNQPAPADSGVVIAKDLASGAERELYRGRRVSGVTLSPDGSTLAFLRAATGDSAGACCTPFGSQSNVTQLVTMPVAGGEPRVLFTGGVGPLSLNWTHDGNRIVFAGPERSGSGVAFHLSVVNVATGQTLKVLSQREQTGGPRLSPDGRRVTFWNTVGGKTRELWAMENLPGGPTR